MLYEKGGETKQSKEETSYQLGAGIEALQRNQKAYYYHQDEQLNTALITNRNGEIKNQYQYDAFGNGLEAIEELPNRIRYTGQQYDQLTEQYYLRARYYNPVLGRFMQEDVYQGDGLNLYTYCRNNPVVYYDPSGYATGTSNPNGCLSQNIFGENPQDYLNKALQLQGLSTVPAMMKEHWTENGYDYEVRVHAAEPRYGKTGSIYRVSRHKIGLNANGEGYGKEYLDSNGIWHHTSTLKPRNTNYNPQAAADTHIQI